MTEKKAPDKKRFVTIYPLWQLAKPDPRAYRSGVELQPNVQVAIRIPLKREYVDNVGDVLASQSMLGKNSPKVDPVLTLEGMAYALREMENVLEDQPTPPVGDIEAWEDDASETTAEPATSDDEWGETATETATEEKDEGSWDTDEWPEAETTTEASDEEWGEEVVEEAPTPDDAVEDSFEFGDD